MFLGGASPLETAEIRIPSLRGALRWWYRALLSGQGLDMTALREKEARVFGGVGSAASPSGSNKANAAGQASSVRLRLSNNILPYDIDSNEEGQNTLCSRSNSEGMKYLWHFMEAHTEGNRPYIKPGATFQVVATAFPGDEEALVEMTKAMWLLSFLGGLGARSRRMAGAFRVSIAKAVGVSDLPMFEPNNSHRFDGWFQKELGSVLSLQDDPHSSLLEKGLPILHPDHAYICRFSSRPNWREAVNKAGKKYKAFRDDSDVKTHEKVTLGLPLPTGKHGSDTVEVRMRHGQTHGEAQTLERRASPLWLQAIHLHPGEDKRTAAIATVFGPSFAPPNVQIVDSGRLLSTTPLDVGKSFLDNADTKEPYLSA